jgi:hypothetical protein
MSYFLPLFELPPPKKEPIPLLLADVSLLLAALFVPADVLVAAEASSALRRDAAAAAAAAACSTPFSSGSIILSSKLLPLVSEVVKITKSSGSAHRNKEVEKE